MKLVRYHITPRSAFRTPLKSDTLTGQLLCLYREKNGEDALKKLLKEIIEGNPPFILSDVFPYNTLPLPVMPPIPRVSFQKIAERQFEGKMFDALSAQKRLKKQLAWISLSDWMDLRMGLSSAALFTKYCKQDHSLNLTNSSKTLQIHNTISRSTGRTLENGGIYTMANQWYFPVDSNNPTMDLYVLIRDDFQSDLSELFSMLEATGYGADNTTGKGHMELRAADSTPDLTSRPEAKNKGMAYWLNLSTYSTTQGDKLEGFYKIKTKFGKVWNGFGEMNPFKWPLLTFESGSVFRQCPENLSHTVIRGVHANPDIIQCTMPIMIPFLLEEAP
ncbi:MAG: hypothetical protein HQM12_17600 [SAR324 cluster bacterium]|nr:hypothetical protein [SAR324 cluster bacterium]